MPQHDTSWWLGFGIGAIAGSLVVGAAAGLVPFVLGQLLNQAKVGRIGFLSCVVASLVGGVLLALPVAVVFVIAVIVMWRRAKTSAPPTSGNAG